MKLVRDKSKSYILLGQLKNPRANFQWSVPLNDCIDLKSTKSAGRSFHVIFTTLMLKKYVFSLHHHHKRVMIPMFGVPGG